MKNKIILLVSSIFLILIVHPVYGNEYQNRIHKFIQFGFTLYPNSLGEKIKSTTEEIKNKYVHDQIDISEKLIFEKSNVYLYHVKSSVPKTLVVRIEFFGKGIELSNSLKIGTSQKTVEDILGPPAHIKSDSIIYEDEALTTELIFKNKKLIQVNYEDNGE